MERRREDRFAVWILTAALLLAFLAGWLLWRGISLRQPDAPSESAVLVYDEMEACFYG